MTDWTDELSPESRDAWDAYVKHFRESTVEQIAGAGAYISIQPSDGKGDVQFWTELGCAVMLDKPFLAIVMPGAEISEKLRLIADEIVEADIDTEEGRQKVAAAIREFVPL